MKRSNMTDYEFAAYLRKLDADWTYAPIEKRPNAAFTEFYAKGRLVALVIYDNAKSERWIYIA